MTERKQFGFSFGQLREGYQKRFAERSAQLYRPPRLADGDWIYGRELAEEIASRLPYKVAVLPSIPELGEPPECFLLRPIERVRKPSWKAPPPDAGGTRHGPDEPDDPLF